MFYKVAVAIITALLAVQTVLAYNSYSIDQYFYQRRLDTDAIIQQMDVIEGSACDAYLEKGGEAFEQCIRYVTLTRGS